MVFRDPAVLAVPAGHPLAERDTVRQEDLAGQTVPAVGGVPDHWLDQLVPDRTPHGAPVHRVTDIGSWQEPPASVGARRGFTLAAEQGIRFSPRPDVVHVPFADRPPISHGLIWRTTGATATVRAFAAAMARWRASAAR
ncbi:LysR substrate-binding domain-containing protein [Streptomyces clavuligerus]|uniref:LysR substrate-binding domain-containing protein n=1 Tax=Streptomyces clavuligerus TaxID=1901 RepID=UPI0001800A1E|nr:LysR substrate-binding domain-containing protein [Streptomyces clavuligerus]ANW16885.1 LysR family transcriptional regulator [Streptomyces clavuligerus]AXU11414.1 LysR family transcriptional regulator [Streptomyces clavuligerus]EDY53385.1 hypothetical protein SSCG_06413 [Streptomyces clavuligerus]MBY6301231.1 LysR family transcriptional regulator [Streptomyces clavuligerus]QCS04285.1 LysR family transcriptional regulator [Streptomyces clavuligerus]